MEKITNNIHEQVIQDDGFYAVTSLVTIFPDFDSFLIDEWYQDEYELSTVIYWQIIYYIRRQLPTNISEVKKILCFLDMLAITHNPILKDILMTWFLENLDNHKDILPVLVEIMPYNLRALFFNYFGEYLES